MQTHGPVVLTITAHLVAIQTNGTARTYLKIIINSEV